MIKDKKILIGVSGSIAAYKIASLVRLLVKSGAQVKVIMTPAATDFITPLTLGTLSKNEVALKLSDQGTWANHVMLGRWADLMVIAPLSCNTLAKMASGACDNLLMAAYLSAICPVVVAPAMDEDMWLHPATKKNIKTIQSFGNHVISVNSGELASGLTGEGRMAEPEEIMNWLELFLGRNKELIGKKVLVTAGPTHEAIDPVRFISNASSGKMGIALASELCNRGASVTLVMGPTSEKIPVGIQVIPVVSAQEMYASCLQQFESMDWAIMSAAVADYTPMKPEDKKIKKQEHEFILPLKKTNDILAKLGQIKTKQQCVIGFALETDNEKQHALGKLKSKNADMIVLNSLNEPGVGFGFDSNKITIFDKRGNEHQFETKSKSLIAADIVNTIINYTNE
jgi:phosphopantothenoylcysteine decarboxylase/phosphopantothenate--cysteine ligase